MAQVTLELDIPNDKIPVVKADQPLTAQDHVYFKIFRDTSVANDFAGTVTVPAFEIIYNSTKIPTSN